MCRSARLLTPTLTPPLQWLAVCEVVVVVLPAVNTNTSDIHFRGMSTLKTFSTLRSNPHPLAHNRSDILINICYSGIPEVVLNNVPIGPDQRGALSKVSISDVLTLLPNYWQCPKFTSSTWESEKVKVISYYHLGVRWKRPSRPKTNPAARFFVRMVAIFSPLLPCHP